MKKILFLADINSSHTRKWVSGVAGLGYDVAVFSLSRPVTDWYSSAGVRLINSVFIDDMGVFRRNDFSKLKYFRLIGELKKCLKSFSPDIVHAHYATSYGLLGKRAGFHPFVLSAWGSDVFVFPRRSILHRLMLKRILDSADVIISASHVLSAEISGYTDKPAEIIPFGIDTDVYQKKETIHSSGFTVGVIKTLEEQYGINYLIEAFKLVVEKYPAEKLRLIIVGEGSLAGEYKRLCLRLGLSSSVTFTGKIPQEEVPDMLNTFDVFVCPSIHESFGVSVIEASACELPVIASDAGGLKEVVIPGETGMLVTPGSAVEIASAISHFVENRGSITEYGKRGRKFVINKFSWKENLKQINDIYKKL